VFCIARGKNISYNIAMPSSTDAQIEEITTQIRKLCRRPFTPEAEAELRKLARQLRVVIRQHVRMATSSLGAKQATIIKLDPDAKKEAS